MENEIILMLNAYINSNTADYRPYGIGQMQISGNVITVCVNQVEPEEEYGGEGYTEWCNFYYTEALANFFQDNGFILVG